MNNEYENEIMKLLNSAQTANAIEAGMKAIIKRFHITEKVIKTLPNGIRKIGVYDKNGVLINSYNA